MITSILRLSIERRWLALSLIFLLIGAGVWSFQHLPIDAVPDITNVQVQINTDAPGYSPLDLAAARAVHHPGPCVFTQQSLARHALVVPLDGFENRTKDRPRSPCRRCDLVSMERRVRSRGGTAAARRPACRHGRGGSSTGPCRCPDRGPRLARTSGPRRSSSRRCRYPPAAARRRRHSPVRLPWGTSRGPSCSPRSTHRPR